MDLSKKSFTYNTFFLTGANILTRATGFLYRIFISRCIGAEGLGLFALITPLYSVCCAVVASGIPVAAMKKISEAPSSERRKSLTLSSLKLVLYFSVLLFLPLYFFSKPIALLLGDVRAVPSVTILSFAVLITGFENVYKSSFYSEGQVKIPAVTEICEQLFRTLCVILMLCYFKNNSVTVASAVLTAGILLGEVLSLLILSLSYHSGHRLVKADRISLRQTGLLQMSLPVTAAKTSESVISSVSDILVPFLLTLFGITRSAATGFLGVVSGMIMPLLYIPCVFTNAIAINLVPFISENLAAKNTGAVIRKCEKAFLSVSVFVFPCTLALITYRDWIADFLFSESRVAVFLPLMSIGGAAAIFRHILTSVMNASGKERAASLYSFLGNGADLLLFLILTPFIGAYGYAVSYLLSNLLLLIPSLTDVKRSLNLSARSLCGAFFPVLPALVAFGIAKTLYTGLLGTLSMTLSVLFSGITAFIVYVFLLYFICLKKKIIFFSKIT